MQFYLVILSVDMHILACVNPVDLVIAMDASGSITQANFRIMQEFVRDLVYGLGIEETGHNIGVATFADSAEVKVNLNSYSSTNDVLNAIDFLFTGGEIYMTTRSVSTPNSFDKFPC